MGDNRRDFLKKTALLGLAGVATSLSGASPLDIVLHGAGENFTLPALPYAYDALEPVIDARTMEIHHSKHHKGYVDKLNTVPAKEVDLSIPDAEKCRMIDDNSSSLLRNNLGGHYNHTEFWKMMRPVRSTGNAPGGMIANGISATWRSFDDFRKEFSEKAIKHFGSGWCWLIKDQIGALHIVTTPNQDNPLMKTSTIKGKPLLGIDVWEHAYYLKYQNKRADYVDGWWNLVNWDYAETAFLSK
jgi:Fe-Mn family superoxide dismutase